MISALRLTIRIRTLPRRWRCRQIIEAVNKGCFLTDIPPPDFNVRRDARESRQLFLDEWRLNVPKKEENFFHLQEIATQYAQIVLKGAFYLNGGALIALPPLMQWISNQHHIALLWSAAYFVLGIVLAAMSGILAYANFQILAWIEGGRSTVSAMEIDNRYSPEPVDLNLNADYLQAAKKEKKGAWWVEATRCLALFFGFTAYFMFCLGVYEFGKLATLEMVPAEISYPITSANPEGSQAAPIPDVSPENAEPTAGLPGQARQ